MRTSMQMTAALAAATALSLGAGRAGAQTVAITGGTVYPVSGPKIENGTVILRDGKVVAVGAGLAVPAGAQRIDAAGKWVTPGFVNGGTQIGVVEIGAVGDTRDAYARGKDQIAASVHVWEGFNARSVLIAPAREEGITTVVIMPGGGLIAGQAGITDLDAPETATRSLHGPVAMVAEIGNAQQGGVGSRGELLGKLRELLSDARFYARNRAAFDRGDSRSLSATRADLDALQPVLAGTLPMLVEADRESDILASLDLAKEFGFRLIIGGGAEAWRLADRLAAAKVPVLTGAMNNIPSGFESLGTRQENAALLRKAGVTVGIIGNAGEGDEESFNVRNLRYEAGNAVSYGMSWDDALRAVTLAPAQIFGAGSRVGSLEAGKVANVVVWSGDPFEFGTRAEHVFVGGREIVEPTRQQLLEDRYRNLPPAYLPRLAGRRNEMGGAVDDGAPRFAACTGALLSRMLLRHRRRRLRSPRAEHHVVRAAAGVGEMEPGDRGVDHDRGEDRDDGHRPALLEVAFDAPVYVHARLESESRRQLTVECNAARGEVKSGRTARKRPPPGWAGAFSSAKRTTPPSSRPPARPWGRCRPGRR